MNKCDYVSREDRTSKTCARRVQRDDGLQIDTLRVKLHDRIVRQNYRRALVDGSTPGNVNVVVKQNADSGK